MTQEEKHDPAAVRKPDYVGGVSWGVSAVGGVLFLIGLIMTRSAGESGWLILLFILPLAIQVMGSVVLFHKPREEQTSRAFYIFYALTMILCLVGCFVAWIVYLCHALRPFTPGWLGIASAVSLLWTVMLMVLVVVMTLAIMYSPGAEEEPALHSDGRRLRRVHSLINRLQGRLEDLRAGASQEPFLAMALFFSVFLGVSYLFGLTFAFHDKNLSPSHALYARAYATKTTEAGPGGEGVPAGQTSELYKFKFASAQSIPDIEKNEPEVQPDDPLRKSVALMKQENQTALDNIISEVKKNKPEDRLRLVIVGHADAKPTAGTSHTSNYELSAARAENVRQRLQERLLAADGNRWRNIEWSCLPQSNEPAPRPLKDLDKAGVPRRGRNAGGEEDEASRYVEVRVERLSGEPASLAAGLIESDKPAVLGLMDYIYFANYTITTTGYGDIIPVTPYSKFICSVANICEVFFLVVFFNALLSLRDRNRHELTRADIREIFNETLEVRERRR